MSRPPGPRPPAPGLGTHAGAPGRSLRRTGPSPVSSNSYGGRTVKAPEALDKVPLDSTSASRIRERQGLAELLRISMSRAEDLRLLESVTLGRQELRPQDAEQLTLECKLREEWREEREDQLLKTLQDFSFEFCHDDEIKALAESLIALSQRMDDERKKKGWMSRGKSSKTLSKIAPYLRARPSQARSPERAPWISQLSSSPFASLRAPGSLPITRRLSSPARKEHSPTKRGDDRSNGHNVLRCYTFSGSTRQGSWAGGKAEGPTSSRSNPTESGSPATVMTARPRTGKRGSLRVREMALSLRPASQGSPQGDSRVVVPTPPGSAPGTRARPQTSEVDTRDSEGATSPVRHVTLLQLQRTLVSGMQEFSSEDGTTAAFTKLQEQVLDARDHFGRCVEETLLACHRELSPAHNSVTAGGAGSDPSSSPEGWTSGHKYPGGRPGPGGPPLSFGRSSRDAWEMRAYLGRFGIPSTVVARAEEHRALVAARRIQRAFRAMCARQQAAREAEEARREAEKAELRCRERAVVTIQAGMRGMRGRKDARVARVAAVRRREAATRVQRWWRKILAGHRHAEKVKQAAKAEAAAAAAWHRERAVLIEQARAAAASAIAQGMGREWDAALRIQAAWRGHLARRLARRRRSAAVVIQKWARGWLVRRGHGWGNMADAGSGNGGKWGHSYTGRQPPNAIMARDSQNASALPSSSSNGRDASLNDRHGSNPVITGDASGAGASAPRGPLWWAQKLKELRARRDARKRWETHRRELARSRPTEERLLREWLFVTEESRKVARMAAEERGRMEEAYRSWEAAQIQEAMRKPLPRNWIPYCDARATGGAIVYINTRTGKGIARHPNVAAVLPAMQERRARAEATLEGNLAKLAEYMERLRYGWYERQAVGYGMIKEARAGARGSRPPRNPGAG